MQRHASGLSWRLLCAALVVGCGIATPASVSASEEGLRAEIQALRHRVAELEAGQRSFRNGSDRSDAAPLRMSRPGLEAEVYGFLTTQAFYETAHTSDRFLNVVPFTSAVRERGATQFNVNASRLGLRVNASGLEDPFRLSVRGRLELDFDTPDGGLRIRHAYTELSHPMVDLLIGQTWSVVGQLNPDTINNDNLFNLGNLYERLPQIRLGREFELDSGRLRLEVATLDFFGSYAQGPIDGVPLAVQQPAFSSYALVSSGLPQLQGRIAWWPRSDSSAYAALALSGGTVEVKNAGGGRQTVVHLLTTAELALPSWGPFRLSAELFYGQAPGFNAGVGQIVAIGLDGEAHAIRSWGGFVQLAYEVNDRLRCNLLYGIDDPENRVGGLEVAIARNQTGLANCFYEMRPFLELGLEIQGVETLWRADQARTSARDLRVTPAIYFWF